jgi:aspartate racemase
MIGDRVCGMHIGLIGGIGPGAMDFYYRRLISTFARKNATLELTIVHADTPTLLSNLARNYAVVQTAIYTRLTNRLVSAAAECVAVTSIAGHFCIDEFKAVSPLPVVDMIAEVSRAIEARGLKRIGIIGTRTVMETRFYGRIASAEIVPPSEPDIDDVHQAYISMAKSGFVTEDQRSIFNAVSHRLLDCTVGDRLRSFGLNHLLWFPITGSANARIARRRRRKWHRSSPAQFGRLKTT